MNKYSKFEIKSLVCSEWCVEFNLFIVEGEMRPVLTLKLIRLAHVNLSVRPQLCTVY
jgi:hypothetical protein